MDLGLKGLRALVTGGSKGIGRRCAEILVGEGARVAICARTQADVQATAAELGVHGTAVDVSDKAALEAWVTASADAMGGIDIVIGNVSALAVADDEAAWQAGFEIDLMHCGTDHQGRALGRAHSRCRRAHHRLVGPASLLSPEGHPMKYVLALALFGMAAVAPVTAVPAAAQAVAARQTVTFTVDNMTCALCPITVKAAMEGVEGVQAVEIDFEARTARVVFDPAVTDAEAIATASANAGYPARVASSAG